MPNGKRRATFESWGRYPSLSANVVPLHWTSDFPLSETHGPVLPVGMGRSYGDVCLLDGGTLLATRAMDRIMHFNPATGILRCESGTSLRDILEFAVPRGFFLPVTPGTKYVTIGGAIANDVHGKNHHVAGTFGRHVLRFELVRSDGQRFVCSPEENSEWFAATIGGMGLTGLISWAEINLRPIVSRAIDYRGTKFHGVGEFLDLSRKTSAEYTVAWIDCLSSGRNFARGVFMEGSHSSIPGSLCRSIPPRAAIPFDLPESLMTRYIMAGFNALYYHRQFGRKKTATVDYEPFFYPLDSVLKWNRLYGKSGLLQFQCVLPQDSGQSGILDLLRTITASGLASFLAVIKVFGDLRSPGMLSFPAPGITLALDFPARQATFDLIDRLAEITLVQGGRMYPAKDARMNAQQFRSFYPEWQDFSRYIDPGFDSAFRHRVDGRRQNIA